MCFSFMNLISGYLILVPISARAPRSPAKSARKNIFQFLIALCGRWVHQQPRE